jgi:HAMP domain-containing protein
MEEYHPGARTGLILPPQCGDTETWVTVRNITCSENRAHCLRTARSVHGLTWSEQNACIYGAGDRILKIDPAAGTAEELPGEPGGAIRGLTWDAVRNRLLGVNMGSNTIVLIDPHTGEMSDVSRLTVRRNNGDRTPLKSGTYGLAMGRDGQTMFGAATIDVLHINAADYSCRRVEYMRDDTEMRGELYRRYLMPMIAIRERCGLTYNILGELVDDAQYINYIIDSTQDETVEYVGWVDDFEPVEEGLRDVWFKGYVFLSMYYWEEWGLMKSAYVPIRNEKGRIAGFSGADINISLIEKKTRDALVSVMLISALSLIFAVIISLFISRKLIEPMRNLMDMALKVAAGKFGEQIVLTRPREIFNISNRFNTMSSYIRDVLNRISDESQRFERLRRSRELVRFMNAKIIENIAPLSGQCACVWNDTERGQVSGGCAAGGIGRSCTLARRSQRL